MKGRKGNSSIIESEILIYQTDDGQTKIDVKLEDETVWLTQTQLCDLYQTSKSNISEHIKHIFEEGELEENAVVRKFRTTAQTVDKSPISSERDWTFSMYKMKINVEISMIKAINMI